MGLDPLESTRVVLYERRTAQRIAYAESARLQWAGHDVACTTADLSATGTRCLLPGEGPRPSAGAEVRVMLTLGKTPATFAAQVAWSRKDGDHRAIGLHFVRVDDHQRTVLDATLLSPTASPL